MNPIYKLIGLIILLVTVLLVFNNIADKGILPLAEFMSEHDDMNDEVKTGRSAIEIIDGQVAVFIDEQIQEKANIQTVSLESIEYRNEIHAYARVLDIQSLLDWRSHYRAIQTEKKIAESAVQVSRQEFERLQMLRSEASNISERQLQQARLLWMNDQSKLDATQDKLKDIRIQLLQEWGSRLAEKLMEDEEFSRQLFERKSVLLLVTLEGSTELPDNTDKLFISEQGKSRKLAQEAYFISSAVFPDNQIYGQTYFFHTPAASLRTGVYLDAWIPENSESTPGIYIPPAAVIWYADKPWVYVKTGTETFMRRDLDVYTVAREGWFVKQGFRAGEQIVVHGAQMLLSEEFRWSIPDEDDDP